MDPRPTNYLRQNIVFSYQEFFSFGFLLFYLFINFYKNHFIIIILFIYFPENYFYFLMFRDVPECSGFYRRPFDALRHIERTGSEIVDQFCKNLLTVV